MRSSGIVIASTRRQGSGAGTELSVCVQPPRACGSCTRHGASSGCGGLLPALLSRSGKLAVTVQCPRPTLAKPGDSVELDIEEPRAGWSRLAAVAYLAPVTGLLAGALIGASVAAGTQALADTLTGVMAFAGLWCGWSGGRRLERMLPSGRGLIAQPPLVRLATRSVPGMTDLRPLIKH